MKIQDSIARMLARNAKEHREAAERAAKFDAGLLKQDLESLFIQAKATLGVMEEELVQHFTEEEEIFFPAALLGAPSYEMTQIVRELQRDHVLLTQRLQDLLESFDQETFSTEYITRSDLEKLQSFVGELKMHAARETAKIFPLFADGGKALPALTRIMEDRRRSD